MGIISTYVSGCPFVDSVSCLLSLKERLEILDITRRESYLWRAFLSSSALFRIDIVNPEMKGLNEEWVIEVSVVQERNGWERVRCQLWCDRRIFRSLFVIQQKSWLWGRRERCNLYQLASPFATGDAYPFSKKRDLISESLHSTIFYPLLFSFFLFISRPSGCNGTGRWGWKSCSSHGELPETRLGRDRGCSQ